MSETAEKTALEHIAYLCGLENEPGMECDARWDQTTLPQALDRCARMWPERELLVFAGERYTARNFAHEVDRFGRGLKALGIKTGDHVAVWLANIREYAVAEFAVAALGAAIVPINIRYKKEELEYALRQSDSATLILSPVVLKTDCVAMLSEICPELARSRPGSLQSKALPKLRNVIVVGTETQGTISFENVSRLGDAALAAPYRAHDLCPDTVFILQYTSGTTAFPKAAMLMQGQALRNAFQMAKRAGFDENDRLLSAMPMFHVGGSVCALLGAITVGYRLYTGASFDAGDTLRLIEDERITAYAGLEPMYLAIRNHPDFQQRSRDSLKKGWTAGTPAILRMVAEDIGIRNVCSLYGLSEGSPNVCISHYQNDPYEKRIGTMGRPQPGTEVKVADPITGKPLKRDERGEICVRGWTVMKGYYNNPEETARAIDEESWLHTGDAGYVTADGYLVWTGRIKDTIRVGGENVSAVEVEHLLCTHPKIVAAAVVGVPDDRLQEAGMAFVQLKEGEAATAAEIIEYCRSRVAVFKVPKYVRFVDYFQTTGSGKIQKFLLKQQAIQDLQAADQQENSRGAE